MTNGLEPCPFCHGALAVNQDENGWWHHSCTEYCYLSAGFPTKEEATIAANTRHKRTCEWSIKKGGTFYDVYQCSACGYEYAESRTDHGIKVELIDAKFCPNCGAEVVDGD